MKAAADTDPQSSVRQAREALLQGRGKGASKAEVDAKTRERPFYAEQPVSEQLEALHERTAVARGDTAAMQRAIVRTDDHLASNVDDITSRTDPRRRRSQVGLVVATIALGVLVVRRCRGTRP